MENRKKLYLLFSLLEMKKNIEELLKRTHNTISKLTNYNYELIFVNDNSNDNSLKLLKEKSNKLSNKNYKYVQKIWRDSL